MHQNAFNASPYTLVLNQNDVLQGRGAGSDRYDGNIRFRALVRERQSEYRQASQKEQKDRIAAEIFLAVQARGGRFLRKVDSISEAESLGIPPDKQGWVPITDSAAIEKVKQALRDKRHETAQPDSGSDVAVDMSASTRATPLTATRPSETAHIALTASPPATATAAIGDSFDTAMSLSGGILGNASSQSHSTTLSPAGASNATLGLSPRHVGALHGGLPEIPPTHHTAASQSTGDRFGHHLSTGQGFFPTHTDPFQDARRTEIMRHGLLAIGRETYHSGQSQQLPGHEQWRIALPPPSRNEPVNNHQHQSLSRATSLSSSDWHNRSMSGSTSGLVDVVEPSLAARYQTLTDPQNTMHRTLAQIRLEQDLQEQLAAVLVGDPVLATPAEIASSRRIASSWRDIPETYQTLFPVAQQPQGPHFTSKDLRVLLLTKSLAESVGDVACMRELHTIFSRGLELPPPRLRLDSVETQSLLLAVRSIEAMLQRR